MNIGPVHLREGLHFARQRLFSPGHRRYSGDAGSIVKQTLHDNFDGTMFRCGQVNHRMFYIRDISIAAEGILHAGMRRQLHTCIATALSSWQRAGRVTTTITTGLQAVDVFDYGSDSLPLLLRTLRLLGSHELVEQYRDFLNDQIEYYCRAAYDPETGLVRQDRPFSTTKDNVVRRAPLYASVQLLILQQEIERLREAGHRIRNPFRGRDAQDALLEAYWMPERGCFRDALDNNYVAADQIFIPFFHVLRDESRYQSLIQAIIDEGLADPLPLQYTKKPKPRNQNKLLSLLAPNYQGDTIWTMLGVPFLSVLHERADERADHYLTAMERIIERDHSCIELYNADLSLFYSLGYRYDAGMTWFAPLLRVFEERR
jgi:hypothetical protein